MSKAEKEAALNAKIAAIRAKNEALQRRHAEVQADKKEAEKIQSSVTCTNPKDFSYERRKTPPLGERRGKSEGVRSVEHSSTPDHNGSLNNNDLRGRPRLKESPPPDPSYRFLADRMRDGSSSVSSSSSERQPLPTINLDCLKPEKRKEIFAKLAQDENRSPSRGRGFARRFNNHNGPFGNNGHPDDSWSEDRNGLILREIRADSVTTKYISGDSKYSKKHSKNKNNFNKTTHQPQSSQRRQSIPREGGRGEEKGHSTTTPPQTNSEMSVNAAEWVPQSSTAQEDTTLQGSWAPNEWSNEYQTTTESYVPTSWADEVANEVTNVDSVDPSSQENWYGCAPLQYVSLPPQFGPGPNQYGVQSMYTSTNMPVGHEYYAYPYQQMPPQSGTIPSAVESASNGIPRNCHNPSSSGEEVSISTMSLHANSPRNHSKNVYHSFKNFNNTSNSRYYHNGGSRAESWRSRGEISKIPPRFQKQRPSEGYNKKPINTTSTLSIPKSSNKDPPPGSNQLTIFGISNVINRLGDTPICSKLSQRVIPVVRLKDFRDSISQIDTQRDIFILIHVLDNDAKDIASKTNRNDVEKGIDSDNLANEFCDIIEAILEKIPYLKVFVSTLLPRFDTLESQGLSFPNNVRKVMNVQISSRLRENSKVFFLNNDHVLDCLQDEDKMLALYTENGYILSKYGFDTMLEAWKKDIKDIIVEERLLENGIVGDMEEEEVKTDSNKSQLITDFKKIEVCDENECDDDNVRANNQNENETNEDITT
ncbi:uncharacterized protein [Lepeophtheirus salmonis]|uniref:uncharacterized protein n=1 Tax=Lepeophtheirus salmonis TaxID=72036 RepID=UPI001AE8BDFF|nr:uncharacterized protein LOC121129047 [Lepeophtheirus salmonis]